MKSSYHFFEVHSHALVECDMISTDFGLLEHKSKFNEYKIASIVAHFRFKEFDLNKLFNDLVLLIFRAFLSKLLNHI